MPIHALFIPTSNRITTNETRHYLKYSSCLCEVKITKEKHIASYTYKRLFLVYQIITLATMPTIEETINTLKDMGFSEAQAKKALNKTGWSGIEAAAEWLLSNPDDDGTEDTPAESTTAAAVSIFTPYNLYSWYLYFI